MRQRFQTHIGQACAARRLPGGASLRGLRGWLALAAMAAGCGTDGSLPDSLTPSATAARATEPATEAMPALPPLPPLAGDRLAYRFVDHAGEAQLELSASGSQGQGQGLAERLRAFDSPYKLVSPYSGLRGEAALRVIEVAVADPDVEQWPRPRPGQQAAKIPAAGGNGAPGSSTPPRFDPVWNRYRGVYESKVSLLAPSPSCYRFHPKLDASKTLRGQITLNAAAIPSQRSDGNSSGADVEFSVSLDGKQLWKTRASRKDGTLGRWLPAEIPVAFSARSDGSRHELALCTTTVSGTPGGSGPPPGPAGTAVWGNPELWAEGEGAVAPNLLLILIDTLRADAVPVMPRLRSYAGQSVSFTQAISAATWTRPALLGLLGGDLPTAVGQSAEEMIPTDRDRKRFYALDRRLLPRLLREAGYKISSVGNNFFLLGYPQIGLSLGFDEVADVRHPVADSPAITRAAVEFLRQNQRRSFFLQLHYDAPHWPYTPPPEFLRNIPDELVARMVGAAPAAKPANGAAAGSPSLDPQARAYLGEAAYADAQVGAVLDEMQRLNLSDRTLVVILGDHGEIFDPKHNHFVQALKQPTIYHHGWSAYDEVVRVPLVLGMPGRLPSGKEVASQVRLIDVAPTVLDLLGLGAWRSLLPSGARGAGQSLLSVIFPPAKPRDPPGDRPAFVEGQNIRALRTDGYLYLRRGDPRLQRAQGNDGTGPTYRTSEELYDLRSDPQQHRDLLGLPRDPQAEPGLTATVTRMREEFAHYAPLPPERGLPLTHLLLAPDTRASHLLTGTLVSSDLAMSVQGVRSGEVVPRAPGRIDVTVRAGGEIDLLVDPEARLEWTIYRDGLPVAPRDMLLGPFSLPLLVGWTAAGTPQPVDAGTAAAAAAAAAAGTAAGNGSFTVDGLLLDRLSAAYPPVPGERGEVLLWRDQAAPGVAATSSSRAGGSASEVATLMRDWGYARPESSPASASAPPARPADGGATPTPTPPKTP